MTTLLLIHILSMIASLVATIYMVAAVAASQNVRSWFVRLNLIITSIGLTSGVSLLFSRPLDMRCLVLAAYLIVFAAAYYYVKRKASSRAVVSVND